MTDMLAEEWVELCDEYERARENYLRVHKALAESFPTIGTQAGEPDARNARLAEEHAAWEHWHGVRERMREFVQNHS